MEEKKSSTLPMIFIFDDEDQNMQYISVEGLTTDEYSGIWKDVYDSYKLVQ